jgi:hypothetical protein
MDQVTNDAVIAYTGDTTVLAYTTGARAVMVRLTPKAKVIYDLVLDPKYGQVSIAQLYMSAIHAGLDAGLTSEDMEGIRIYLVK